MSPERREAMPLSSRQAPFRTAFFRDVAGSARSSTMPNARFLWLLVPIAGLAELGLFVYDAWRAPRVSEWQAVRAEVAKLKEPADLLVVAPEWADPIARYAFGDELMPIAKEARPDDSAFSRAVEVATLGKSAPELQGWSVREERTVGRFQLRLRENPKPEHVLFSFLDNARPPSLSVTAGDSRDTERACVYTAHAAASAGGLHGHLAFPRERYLCGGEEFFVGITILDDQEYRPRRCLWAEPRSGESVRLSFSNVLMGRKIFGFGGLSYFIFRDGAHGPTTITAQVQGQRVGSYEHHDERGWHHFEFDTERFAGQTTTVEFDVSSDDPSDRQFCFYADTR
ncbi:MAG: hypothetical protein ABI548_30010 [Polyangiaceae bacterium]